MWSYDISLTTDKDKVRLAIGDTIELDPQLSDEEIEATLSLYGSVRAAAVAMCNVLAAKYARFADKWVGDLKILASQKSRAYRELAGTLASSASGMMSAGVPSAGGIYVGDKQSQASDASLVKPSFRRGMTDSEDWG